MVSGASSNAQSDGSPTGPTLSYTRAKWLAAVSQHWLRSYGSGASVTCASPRPSPVDFHGQELDGDLLLVVSVVVVRHLDLAHRRRVLEAVETGGRGVEVDREVAVPHPALAARPGVAVDEGGEVGARGGLRPAGERPRVVILHLGHGELELVQVVPARAGAPGAGVAVAGRGREVDDRPDQDEGGRHAQVHRGREPDGDPGELGRRHVGLGGARGGGERRVLREFDLRLVLGRDRAAGFVGGDRPAAVASGAARGAARGSTTGGRGQGRDDGDGSFYFSFS